MKLTVPQNETILTTKFFYVSSESDPTDTHIVTYAQHTYFCDCRDFMIRHLPNLGNPKFELCKHGNLVQSNLEPAIRQGEKPTTPNPIRYGIFYHGMSGVFRSGDAPGSYSTLKEAQDVLNEFNKRYPQRSPENRKVRAFYISDPETAI